jgi:dTDP-4-dehydrorhamnose 3,5-epimerase
MTFPRTYIDDIIVFDLPKFDDHRGDFRILYNEINNDLPHLRFVQDNFSMSHKNVVRGLHMQTENPQGKLRCCVRGSILDVAVDLRKDSPTFRKVYTIELTGNKHIYVPPGFACGMLAQEEDTCLYYKCSTDYHGESEVAIHPFDDFLNIDWGLDKDDCIVSDKDLNGISARDFDGV